MEPTIINDDDVYWEMTWGENFPDKPPVTQEFEPELALARMLVDGTIFLNNHWWMKEWPEDARKSTALLVNCNDIFAWAYAEAEEIEHHELEALYKEWLIDPTWGGAVWCIKKRGELPQAPVLRDLLKTGKWNLDELNLKPNGYDAALKAAAEAKMKT